MSTVQNEPVVTAASVAALVSAIILWARLMGWLLVLSAVVLVDIHAADFNGHRSMVARWSRRLQRRKAHHAQ